MTPHLLTLSGKQAFLLHAARSDVHRLSRNDSEDVPATPTRAGVAHSRSHAAALPGKAGLQGAVPHAQDPRPGLGARGLAGEGRAAGRGVDQEVAEQQAVEAAKDVHHTAGQEPRR